MEVFPLSPRKSLGLSILCFLELPGGLSILEKLTSLNLHTSMAHTLDVNSRLVKGSARAQAKTAPRVPYVWRAGEGLPRRVAQGHRL